MLCIIFYDYYNHEGCIVVDGSLHYSVARLMIPKGAKYKGMKKVEKLDLRIGTRLVEEVRIR